MIGGEGNGDRRALVPREGIQPLNLGIEVEMDQKTEHSRNSHKKTIGSVLFVGKGEDGQRRPLLRLPKRLEGGHLFGLGAGHLERMDVPRAELQQ